MHALGCIKPFVTHQPIRPILRLGPVHVDLSFNRVMRLPHASNDTTTPIADS